MLIKYNENNSGGERWLTDEDADQLQKHGWKVNKDWLGLVDAEKEFNSISDAVLEFESITKKSVLEMGCKDCCDPPHGFGWEGKSASGSEIMRYLTYEERGKLL